MSPPSPTVRAIRPDRAVHTPQRLPYFHGVSGSTVGATGLFVASNDPAEQDNVVPYRP